jgi:hypothetical protein
LCCALENPGRNYLMPLENPGKIFFQSCMNPAGAILETILKLSFDLKWREMQ